MEKAGGDDAARVLRWRSVEARAEEAQDEERFAALEGRFLVLPIVLRLGADFDGTQATLTFPSIPAELIVTGADARAMSFIGQTYDDSGPIPTAGQKQAGCSN